MPQHDSAPIVGYFSDSENAEQCLRELRNSGIRNEQIGVSYSGSTVITPANSPGVQRATDQARSTSEIMGPAREDTGVEQMAALRTPTDGQFDSEGEAHQYKHPAAGVMVSVSIEPVRREEIRHVLQHYGARLSDWPQDQVA